MRAAAFLPLLILPILATPVDEPPGRPERRDPRHRALLIGIGDYEHFNENGPRGASDLHGPPNDLELIQGILKIEEYGFAEPGAIRVLLDWDATKEAIEAGFRWLVAEATEPEDVVLIYYSGHGTNVEDRDGDEAETTPGDERDEALVPSDAIDPKDPEAVILDDQIRAWLAEIGTRNITVIIDACFSGTATRGQMSPSKLKARGPSGPAADSAAFDPLEDPEHTLLTASDAGESSWENAIGEGRRSYGIFTYHLVAALEELGPEARYDRIISRVRRRVAAVRLQEPQTPQLEGDRGARLFRVQGDLPRRRYVGVRIAGDGAYTIDAGAVHGVRNRAVYDVYPDGELTFVGEPLARLAVIEVGETEAIARQLDSETDIPTSARAVLARLPIGAGRIESIGVHVEPDAEPVRGMVEAFRFVRLVHASEADAVVQRDGEAYRVFLDGGELPPIKRDSLYKVPGEASSDSAFAGNSEALCSALSRVFSVRTFGAIRNPQPRPDLDVELQFVPIGDTPVEDPAVVDTLTVGRSYRLYARIRAPEGSRYFVSVAVTGRISPPFVIYPQETGENTIFELNSWQRISGELSAEEPIGEETLEIVAVPQLYDFRTLVSSLRRLCDDPTAERAQTRGGEEDELPLESWKSAERRVVFMREPDAL